MVCKTVKASFPSSIERAVASALLLLASSSPEETSKSWSPERYGSSRFSSPKSCDGSSSSDASAEEESPESPAVTSPVITVVSTTPPKVHSVAQFTDLKLKIVRKKRSKTICISNVSKTNFGKPKCISAQTSSECASEITTADTSSCLSSSSSAQSPSNRTNASDKPKKPIISGHLGCLAASIRRILSVGSASEVRIRQMLGDSPSTSKALRMLLKVEEVKRCGTGGRSDPFIYMLA